MNILFVSETVVYTKQSHGGAEYSMAIMAEEFIKLNHNVIHLYRGSKKKVYAELVPEKLQIFRANYIRGASRLKFIKFLNKLILTKYINKIYKKLKFDIVYIYYSKQLVISALHFRNKKQPNIKIIMRMAGLSWYEGAKANNSIREEFEFIFNSVDSINYVHSELKFECKNLYQKLKMDVKPPHEFILDIGTLKRNSELINKDKKELFKIIMVARFSNYQKRQDIVIKAMSVLSKTSNIELLFIGEGEQLNLMKSLVKKLDLDSKIDFLPFQDQDDLWKILRDCDLLVHATEYEGLSKIILESMAIGLPVLASDVVPMNIDIKDGENGFLVSNKNREWAEKLDYIYQNQNLLNDIRLNARNYVNKKYDSEQSAVEFIQIFQNIKRI